MPRRLTWMLLGGAAILAAMEVFLRLLPTPTATFTGKYVDRHMTTYPPGHEFRSSTGWSLLNPQTHKANAHGFIPDRPFTPATGAVALIGDSLVEESMLPVGERLASILQESRGQGGVFSMGLGGSGLFDYLERVRYASEKLGVTTFWIVVERADIRESACEGGTYFDACLNANGRLARKESGERDPVRDALARSQLLQYFVGVLRLSPERLLAIFRSPKTAPANGQQVPARAAVSPMDMATIERFLQELRQIGSDRVGLILDPEVGDLRRSEPFGNPALAQLYRRAREMGIAVVHPRRALAEYSIATGLDMRVGPYDNHWNVHANCVIAREILDTLPGGSDTGRTPSTVCGSLGQIRSNRAAVSSTMARHMSGSE